MIVFSPTEIITFTKSPKLKVSIIQLKDLDNTRIDNNDFKLGDLTK